MGGARHVAAARMRVQGCHSRVWQGVQQVGTQSADGGAGNADGNTGGTDGGVVGYA